MKKANVLQLTIVLIGIVFGFFALQYLFSSLYGIFSWIFSDGYSNDIYSFSTVTIFATIGLQAVTCWVLISNSDKLAAYIYRKSGMGKGLNIISRPNDLLYILLIAIGLYLLLTNLVPLIRSVFESFTSRARPSFLSNVDDQPVLWVPIILNLLLPLILLMFAKPIADYFAKNLSEEIITIEEDTDQHILPETPED